MKDKEPFFIDSNVLIYGYYGERSKSQKFDTLLRSASLPIIISTQVLKEFSNVCLKKQLCKSTTELMNRLEIIYDAFTVAEIQRTTLKEALNIYDRFKYSFYDSLLIAAALEHGCKTFYSEDLHHGQAINGKMKIMNPFI